jgi:hypothetical protein
MANIHARVDQKIRASATPILVTMMTVLQNNFQRT